MAAGAIGAIVTGALMSAARGSVSGTLIVLAFVAFAVGGALIAFRSTVPMELILWRNKTEEARPKVIGLLASGEDEEPEAVPPGSGRKTTPAGAARQGAPASADPSAASPETQPAAAKGADLLRAFIAAETEKLKAFADQSTTALMATYPQLSSFQRYGFNLWLAGALEELSRRDTLTPATAEKVLLEVLTQTGTPHDAATAFHSRLADATARPRFKRMIDAGRAAISAQLDQLPVADDMTAVALMQSWSSSSGQAAGARTAVLLLTDMVGSTAMTGKLGNSGAQRVVRAHNSIVRAVIKLAHGAEVKHTGDGILASFDTAVAAAQAAVEIQQEVATMIRATPDLPLTIRVGLHEGEVISDGDDLFCTAIGTADDVCAAGNTGEIIASLPVQQKSAGGVYKYAPVADKTVAVDGAAVALFKLIWEPKRAYGVPPIEYRQIGTRPTPE